MQTLCHDVANGENWSLYNGDCCEVIKELPDESVHFTIFSPPFCSLYVYSDSERDMGNCATEDEFWEHFNYLIPHLYRVTKPGRLCSVHCMNIPTTKTHHGYIGIQDFRGDVIRNFQKHDWIYHSEVCIWKDPVVAMTRTKALGLLHKQLVKDSAMSRQGIPDYVVTFRKPGNNPEPVAGELDHWIGDNGFERKGNLSIDIWQKYASPVWMDIQQSDTLNFREARSEDDERHLCPLQLPVIQRCCQLWSNEGDIVLSPFAGVGSEGYGALELGRKFIGIELKPEYFEQAKKNLTIAENKQKEQRLF